MKTKKQMTAKVSMTAGHATQVLQVLHKLLLVESMSANEVFRVADWLEVLSADSTVAATERTRVLMLKKHGEPTADGSGVTLPPARMAAFVAEFGPIANKHVEFDLNPLPRLVLSHLPKPTPADILALRPFLARE
jgi:hypothetical protein